MSNPINITVYRWAGAWGPFRVNIPCGECSLTGDIIRHCLQTDLAGIDVELVVRDWLTEWWRPSEARRCKCAIVLVNDKVISQGIALNGGAGAPTGTRQRTADIPVAAHISAARLSALCSGAGIPRRGAFAHPITTHRGHRALYEMIAGSAIIGRSPVTDRRSIGRGQSARQRAQEILDSPPWSRIPTGQCSLSPLPQGARITPASEGRVDCPGHMSVRDDCRRGDPRAERRVRGKSAGGWRTPRVANASIRGHRRHRRCTTAPRATPRGPGQGRGSSARAARYAAPASRARDPASRDAVLFTDGDRAFHASQAPRLLDALADGADLVIGSRTLGRRERGALTRSQTFGNAVAAILIRVLFGQRVTDLGPYRAIRAAALDRLGMADPAFGWTVEMQVKASKPADHG